MSTSRPPDDLLAAWLDENNIPLPAATRRAIEVGIGTVRQRRGPIWLPSRRFTDMNSFAKLAIAAAAVVVIAVAGTQFLPRSETSGGQPSPTAALTATPAFAQLTNGPLAPGRYVLYDGLATSIEVPAGWIGKPPFVRKMGADGAGLWWGPIGPVSQVFSDACKGPNLTPVDGTVRGLVDALDAQVGTDATISEVTLGGLPATRLDLVKDLASCSGGADSGLNLWSTPSGSTGLSPTGLSPGASGIVYVLEKDGELVVFIGVNYKAAASDVAELEGVIASTQFGP
jgi:hypothetical protein